jgi:hypothetical protein
MTLSYGATIKGIKDFLIESFFIKTEDRLKYTFT